MALLDVGREIVSNALRDGDVRPYLDRGWDLEWSSDRQNILRLAVFPEPHGEAWQFILRHRERHGQVPTANLFRLQFPTYELPENDHTPDELIEIANGYVRAVAAQEAMGDLGALLMADDWDAFAERMAEGARVMQQTSTALLPFRLLSLADIDNLPDPEVLIDGLIDHGTVTKLVGESGKGKSFVAIDWSLCVATGRRWQGRQVRKGRVLYIAAEGAYGLKKRIRAWTKTYGDVPPDAFVLIPDAVQLADAGQLAALVKVAKDFDVVVIDTLARTSAGLEENSAKDMGLYINACYKIRDSAREAGATVLVVHHTGYDTKRARGSSALFANGDGEILIESDDPHALMTMTVKKRKDGEAGQQLHLHLETVDCGDWTSCVVQETDAPEPRQTNAEKVLDAIREGSETQADITAATGIDKGTVSRELGKLTDLGQVVKIPGRPAKYAVAEQR